MIVAIWINPVFAVQTADTNNEYSNNNLGGKRMVFKQHYRWISAAVVLAPLCFIMGRVVIRARPAASHAQQAVTAFTLRGEIISLAHSPEGEVHRRQTIAVRSDGSRSLTETILGTVGLRAGEKKRSIRFADGRSLTIFPSMGVKNTWPTRSQTANEQARAQRLNPPQDCLYPGWTFVQNDTVQGQEVAVVSHSSQELGWKATAWRAPQLGCEMLRYISYDSGTDGNFVANTELRTVALQLGEPDPALFDEATTYREAKPTEVGQIIAQKYHLTLGTEANNWLQRFDSTYSGSRGPSLHNGKAR